MSFFREEVFAHKKNQLWGEVLVKPTQFYIYAASVLGVVTFLALLVVVFGKYATKETVPGTIEPIGGIKSIYAPLNGYVTEVLHHPGEELNSGQIIMKIQAKQMTDSGVLFDANYKQELLSDKGRLEQKKIILKKNAELRAKELSSEKNQINNQIQNHQEQLALHRKALALSQDQLERMKDAYEKGAVARIVFEKQELETNHYTKELHNMERDLKVLSAKMQQCLLGEEIEEQKFNEQLLQLEQLQSDLQKRIIEHERMEGIAIYAPVDGHITYMNFKSGQFVRAGEHLADLQAKDDVFRAKLYIPSKSIGLMKVGLNVSMRIHAFPYAHYGTLRGKIESISESLYQGPEAKTALYVAYVVLDDQFIKGDNRIYLLKQGLTLDADIKTQEMSLVAKIFEPLNRFRRS